MITIKTYIRRGFIFPRLMQGGEEDIVDEISWSIQTLQKQNAQIKFHISISQSFLDLITLWQLLIRTMILNWPLICIHQEWYHQEDVVESKRGRNKSECDELYSNNVCTVLRAKKRPELSLLFLLSCFIKEKNHLFKILISRHLVFL